MGNFPKGIIILTTGRAGSSMTAGVFARHGVWHGPSRMQPSEWNRKGFFQNGTLHKLMKDYHGRDIEGPVVKEANLAWLEEAKSIMLYQGMTPPWFFKTGAHYYKCMEPLVDKVIKIYRPFEKVMDSYRRCNFLPFQKWDVEFIVKRQMEYMDKLPGVFVNTEELVQDDLSSLEDAFDYCGLDFDRKIAEAFIDPNLFSI